MQASVRVARYATETTPQIEAGMQRVTGLFEQYVKLCQSLNYETMIAAVRMEDPAKLTDTMAFMFETHFPQRVTKYAAQLEQLQDDYLDCWRGLRKHFDPGTNKP